MRSSTRRCCWAEWARLAICLPMEPKSLLDCTRCTQDWYFSHQPGLSSRPLPIASCIGCMWRMRTRGVLGFWQVAGRNGQPEVLNSGCVFQQHAHLFLNRSCGDVAMGLQGLALEIALQ